MAPDFCNRPEPRPEHSWIRHEIRGECLGGSGRGSGRGLGQPWCSCAASGQLQGGCWPSLKAPTPPMGWCTWAATAGHLWGKAPFGTCYYFDVLKICEKSGFCSKWLQKSRWLPLGALKASGGLRCHTAQCKAAPAHRSTKILWFPRSCCAGTPPVSPLLLTGVGAAAAAAAVSWFRREFRGPTAAIARCTPSQTP